MGDLNIIDSFMSAFISYIDSGFGLLRGDVGHLTSILIVIDVTLAALFWVLDNEANVLARLIKKVLYIGAFAFILNNFKTLADIIFESFSDLGLQASANTMTADDLLKPGKLAGIGFTAAHPLLDQAAQMLGLDSFFSNFITIVILLVAWLIVLLAFFVLAIQLFITVIEFKLTTLAGFVLVPFAFWNKSAFLAERVLGNVITSGVKVMVLAVIVGIGSSFFDQFITALNGVDADVGQAMSLVLASLTLLGLGIFGPSIASGLVAGAPQLGAGAAVGTLGTAGAAALLATSVGAGAIRAIAGGGRSAMAAIGAASSMGGSGNGSGSAPSGTPNGGPRPSGGGPSGAAPAGKNSSGEAPAWARQMREEAATRTHLHAVQAAVSESSSGGASASPDITQKE